MQTYLRRGAASSADDLLYLLDELNAYSHDLASATKLVDLHKRNGQVDHRAGLAALMSFLMHYVEVARERKVPTWEGLRRPEVKRVVGTLWQQAESHTGWFVGYSWISAVRHTLRSSANGETERRLPSFLVARP